MERRNIITGWAIVIFGFLVFWAGTEFCFDIKIPQYTIFGNVVKTNCLAYDLTCALSFCIIALGCTVAAFQFRFIRYVFYLLQHVTVLWIWRFITGTNHIQSHFAMPCAVILAIIIAVEYKQYEKMYSK